jgi:DNA polymerase-3 subunit gamma/tau
VLELVRTKRAALASVLEHASVLAFSRERVVLGYESGSFLAVHATEAPAVLLLQTIVREHFSAETEVRIDTEVQRGSAASVAQIEAAARRVRMDAARRAVAEHPLVHAAIEVLGAELRDVRLGQEFADA